MARIEEKLVEEARKVDFMAFLEHQEGWHFMKIGTHCYRCIEHESFMLNKEGDFLWYNWYSQKEKGNIISYVQNHITSGDFRKAIAYILNSECISYCNKDEIISNEKEKIVLKGNVQIETNDNMRRTFGYLIKNRKINFNVVNELVKQGKIVEDKKHNIVFKYINSEGIVVGGEEKGTYSDKAYRSVVTGTDETYGFTIIVGDKCKNIFVFEAAIDLISYYEIFKSELRDSILLSLGGCTKTKKINTYLKLYKTIDTIIVCEDNDDSGNISFKTIKDEYSNYIIRDGRNVLIQNNIKDFNDMLKNKKTNN
ncbi:DUF3991 and TOPRIM domain-containing protein [Clostridium tagluense]|uniref:DUF3991 and TOPRIM domain-containing protein n=1 Tax=Clostridium tagluense TaxID=360422 RepID=UPI001CF5759C|nr:DUF3991 and TOPRIM domain-containing protein [Clostridium tagluense]MCB2299871.1 DUF3991 and toprim domain-containing protein [Clostridium tagluense]